MKSTAVIMLVAAIAYASSGCSERDSTPANSGDDSNVVEVTARGLQFEAPDEIPSGWTTFRFSNESGMIHELTVTEESSGASEPRATLTITLSSTRGIEVEGDPTPAKHTVLVHFEDQIIHENFLGHDVHLARLENDTDIEELAIWMDWSQPTGLETPAPVEFMGGTHEMPAGGTAYFTVHLEPGRYAWIAEVPSPAEKGMLKTFTVVSGRGSGD